jgi:hypothetical protein
MGEAQIAWTVLVTLPPKRRVDLRLTWDVFSSVTLNLEPEEAIRLADQLLAGARLLASASEKA